MVAYYIHYKPKKSYLIVILGFLIMSYSGGKRGIWLYLPLMMFIALFYSIKIHKVKFKLEKLIFAGTIILSISIFALVFGAKNTKTLNPQNVIGGQFDPDYIQKYAIDYTFSNKSDGSFSTGRGTNLINVSKKLLDSDWNIILFGFGPEAGKGVSLYGEGIWQKLGVNGPVPGITYHMVQLGFLGSLIVLFYAIKIAPIFHASIKERTKPVLEIIRLRRIFNSHCIYY